MRFKNDYPALKDLLKAFSAPLAHGLRMAANLIILKMIAVVLGPLGLGGLGNFMSFTTMVSVFAGGGITTGITKYVAEYSKSPRQLVKFLGSAFAFGFLFSIVFLLVSVAFADRLSLLLFGNNDFSWLIPLIGFSQSVCFFGAAVIAIANGQKRQDIFSLITLTAYILSIPISFVLISSFEINGAVIALLVVASSTGGPAIYFAWRSRLTRLVRLRFKGIYVKKLLRFSMMVLTSALFFPLSEIFIRTLLIQRLGHGDAGLWQAMTRLSGAYLGFFTLYLSTSYMPYLSSLVDRKQVTRAVVRTLIIIGIQFSVFSFLLYSFKKTIVALLFSDAFLTMTPLFAWQLIGDFFRLSAYVIGFLGVAKAAFRMYVFCEFLQVSLLTSFAFLTLNNGGLLVALVKSYAFAYFLYFIVMLFALFKYDRGRFDFSR